MKKETKELIDGLNVALRETAQDNDGLHWLNCKGNECLSGGNAHWTEKILKGEYCGCLSLDPESNYNQLMALFKRMEETEVALANGGLVKDGKGNWLASGTKVRYKSGSDRGAEWHFGSIHFDPDNWNWYLADDMGDFPYLAKDYGEVLYFEKEE